MRGPDGLDRPATVSGRFRFDALATSDYPAVGDWVALEPSAAAPGTEDRAVIAAILPRRSAFTRSAADASRRTAGHLADEQVIAANVDVAFIVAGLDHDFNLRRLERYLAVAWSSSVTPVIVLNKADIADDLDGRLVAVGAIAPGVPVVVLSALTGDHLADLLPHLVTGRTAVVLGSSGVGKSTLVERAPRRGSPVHRRRPRGRLARPPHDHPPRAVRAARRRAADRHARDPLAGGGRRRRGRRDRLRRHPRAGGDLPLQRLPRTRASQAARSRRPSPPARSAPTGSPATASSSASSLARSARPIRGRGPSSGASGRSSTSRSTST